LAYLSNNRTGQSIMRLDVDEPTAEPETIIDLRGFEGPPDWSRQGENLVFTLDIDFESQVYTLQTAERGAHPQHLTYLNDYRATYATPAWSPDGSKIAYAYATLGTREVFVVDVTSGEAHNLTHNPGDDGEPAWSPDGTRLVFWSNRDGNYELYMMRSDGSGLRRLTYHPSNDSAPAWRPVR
jgi:Tol biopolymer transport system component